MLAELRRCGLTDSETCLRSLTLSLDAGRTVSAEPGRGGAGLMGGTLPPPWPWHGQRVPGLAPGPPAPAAASIPEGSAVGWLLQPPTRVVASLYKSTSDFM